ncbi:hypothetical protein BH10BAC2_BH10BAC2_17800 [soil metagenome]
MKQLILRSVCTLASLLFLQAIKAQSDNTKYGELALYFNTSGSGNSAFGTAALYLNRTGYGNSAFGSYTLYVNTGINNTAIGIYALYNNTTGINNTASGAYTLLYNWTGSNNTASGTEALYRNTTGNNNTATGYQVLYSNTIGSQNTAIGYQTLYYNTTGSNNTASGFGALDRNTTGFSNTATGANAMYFNTTGSHNVASGNYALKGNTTGSGNTALGDSAGARFNYTNGTFIGNRTTTTSAALSNVTVIGFQASATASNQVRVGNNTVTSIGGKVGWTTFSDGRFKKNVKENVPGLAFIIKLRPVTYTLDIEDIDKASGITEQPNTEEMTARAAATKEKHTGFVAQEVEAAAKQLGYDFGGVDKPKNDKDFYGLRYAEFVVPLVKAVQEQNTEIEELKKEIADLKSMVLTMLSQVQGNNTYQQLTVTRATLEQNIPNPSKNTTSIGYYLPASSGNAYINFYASAGSLLKSVKVTSEGKGMLTLNASDLPSGVYQYALVIEGKIIDKKQMVIAK